MPRGGIRIGAGRPKGQGKFGEKTKPIRIPLSMVDNVLSFIKNNDLSLPIYSNKVTAGFPSPADDHIEGKLDLNTHLIKHPSATFFVKATGKQAVEKNPTTKIYETTHSGIAVAHHCRIKRK